MVDWAAERRRFPALEDRCWLNAASMSPLPRPVHREMARVMEVFLRGDPETEAAVDHAESLRLRAAGFLRCRPEELAFLQSCSEGTVRAALALDWRAGDNVVAPRASFPSITLPLRPLAERGVEVRWVGEPGGGTAPDEATILEAVDRRTRLVCVSWVSFITGRRLDLDLLGKACRDRGALLYADLMQGVGAVPVDLGAWAVDLAAFQPVKWIPAPSGLGLFYCRRELVERLPLPQRGWTSLQRRGLEDLTRVEGPWWPGARRWDVGSVSPLLARGFEAALAYLEDLGAEAVGGRVLRLGQMVSKILKEKGFKVLTPEEAGRRAGITTFACARSGPVVAKLKAQGVVVADREGCVRVSTHFYNDEGDLDRLAETLTGP